MNRVLSVCFLSFFLCFSVKGQRKAVPQEVLNGALDYAQQIEEEDLIIVDKTITVTFERGRSGIKTILKEQISLMNPKNATRFDYPLFYDDESAVTSFRVYKENGSEDRAKRNAITDSYLEDEDLFHTDYRVKKCPLSFLLPKTVYTIVTEKRFNDPKYFTSVYFTNPSPLYKGKLVIQIPDWLELDLIEKNFEDFSVEESSSQQKGITTKEYSFQQLPGQADERNAPGPSYLYPHVLFVTKSRTKSDGQKVTLMNSVDDLYGWYSGLAQSVDQDTSQFESFVADLTAGAKDDQEKIQRIYYWVQDNIRYIAFEDGIAGFQPAPPAEVFEKRYGDCKGMAILTKTLLKTAGFDARLVWLGTDRLAYDYSIPSLAVDNHMICAINLEDQFIFLDGTEKYNSYGEYAGRILGREVLIEGSAADNYERVTLPAENSKPNSDVFSYQLKVTDQALEGTGSRQLSGESRAVLQYRIAKSGTDNRQELLSDFLANGNRNVSIDQVSEPTLFERDQDLQFDFDISIAQSVSEFDGVYYVDLNFLGSLLPSIKEDRKTPFYFRLYEQQKVLIDIALPEGKSLSETPDSLSIDNDLLSIDLKITDTAGGSLIVERNIVPKKRIIEPEEFLLWNAAMVQYKEVLGQQLIFK